MRRPKELDELLLFSAQLGRDLLLTQGSAGNTSMKIDGRLWVKASGRWLANAVEEDIFLPLDLEAYRSLTRRDCAIPIAVKNSAGDDLTPSIETAMHAVLPHRVVAHLHSVNTIAVALRSDAPECLESRLKGLRWQWIPYVISGLTLARDIERVLWRSQNLDVLVLGNHGLVVCGADCGAVGMLLKEVELRLGALPRSSKFDRDFLLRLAEGSNWQLPEYTRLHALATDQTASTLLEGGCLYPCQLLVLGGSAGWQPFYSGLFSEASRGPDRASRGRPFLIVKGKGVLLSDRITKMQLATLSGLAEIVQRVEPNAPVRYLSEAECAEIAAMGKSGSGRSRQYIALSA